MLSVQYLQLENLSAVLRGEELQAVPQAVYSLEVQATQGVVQS